MNREDRKGHCSGPRGPMVSLTLALMEREREADRPGLEEPGQEEV